MKKIIILSLIVISMFTTTVFSLANELPNYYDSFEANNIDASLYDWEGNLDRLLTLEFQSNTIWPDDSKMPEGFKEDDRKKIVEYGLNPGLEIRAIPIQLL